MKGGPALSTDGPKDNNQLIAHVEHVTFHDPASGYTVAQVLPSGDEKTVTVVGNLMGPSPGMVLRMTGHWTEHARFGRQFKVERFEALSPVTVEGIESYLGSGTIKGIGRAMARRLVDRFGEKTLTVIDGEPERLMEVSGIGAKKAAAIREAWQTQQAGRQVMLFLQSHGVSSTYAAKILRQYGPDTIRVVKDNPYALADDIFGIGFLIADAIAAKLGLAKDSPRRLQAGIRYTLQRLADAGHLYCPYESLVTQAADLLRADGGAVADAIAALARERLIVIERLDDQSPDHDEAGKAVFLSMYHACETLIAGRLRQLCTTAKSRTFADPARALDWVQARLGLELDPHQREAVEGALVQKVLVITGGPGTGKTTIVQAITRIYAHRMARILLAAPTGRAAKQLGDTTGRSASTIHRLLEYNPREGGFQRNRHNPLDADLLVIDEVSMIDTVLMYHLLQAVPDPTTLILVGDVNQLPSVGPGSLLEDILRSRTIPLVRLRQIFRQARRSRIVTNAHRINDGKMPDLTPPAQDTVTDFYFIEQEDPEKILGTIITLVSERIPRRFHFDPVEEVQVLTPMHRGVVGARNLNTRLQEALNPQEAVVSRGEHRFGAHDKVMQLRNNYDKQVFNGDIGRILDIDPHRRSVAIQHDRRTVDYDFEELDEISLAYAVSVHKSQGSEFPAVVIPVTTQHYLLLQRNLIYTAITRARRLVVLVGSKRALAMAVRNNAPRKRYTRLAHRLQAAMSPTGPS